MASACVPGAPARSVASPSSLPTSRARRFASVRTLSGRDRIRACVASAYKSDKRRPEWSSARLERLDRASSDEVAVALPASVVQDEARPAVLDAYQQWVGRHWDALPARFKLIVACSFSFVICNMDKVNMSVAIIPMSQEFGWSASVSGLVQSSFFWGYLLVQLPGGYISNRFGGHRVLPAAVTTWSVATALVPPLASTIPSLCASRAAVGLGEGAAPSAAIDMVVRTVPAEERSRAVSFVLGGLQIGSILGLLAAPVLIDHLGWQGVFYVFGAMGLVWATWFNSVLDDPKDDMARLRANLYDRGDDGEALTVPWRAFLRNGPVRALMFTHFCQNWCHYTMLAWLPSYFKDALAMDLGHASAASLIPPLASIAVSFVGCQLVDAAISSGAKVAHVRKVAQCIAFLVPAALLVGASQSHGSYWSIAYISAALGVSSLSLSGFYCTHQDISPKYSSTLLGVTNTSGSIPGIIGVTAVGAMLDLTHNWEVALLAPTILFFTLGAFVYTRYSVSDPQEFVDNTPFAWEGRVRALLPWGKDAERS